MQINGDYHIHTNYCPHGSSDRMEEYVQAAIKKGLNAISFTEHAPLPPSFTDPVPKKDSAMRLEDVESYISEGNKLKEQYKDKLKINIGFEVDYIKGFEAETMEFLNQFGEEIDDAILSVHMLQTSDNSYVCLDYSVEAFSEIITLFGSVDAVYQAYFQTVASSINADLGPFKPTRIGHINLVEKFSKQYPPINNYEKEIIKLLHLVKQRNYTLDANTAGLYKEFCKKMYPPKNIMETANELGIALIPGSDSHTAKTVTRGFDNYPSTIILANPHK
ncbi:Histidinol-phosphatase [Paraliobacillus sp. PM-2]|uniref:histidinol-phosphatase HisJ n=1 Tax=Paraliobacillus sp. PM-2 TaxID=1462524 RepID=UPI00061BD45C|nr:histidinol-phosphatase HisJ [Paraliobacillus sp. PM-2]CQR47583.1 Histidinol-phosphatase [Paraliobacillus sp. PM-2]